MIRVMIEGHSYKHGLFELIRVFFPGEEIHFVDDETSYGEGLFIKTSLLARIDKNLAISKVYNMGDLIKEIIIDIDKIHISGYPKERIVKNAIKKSIYDSLIDLSENHLPWGILTGIRPIKVAHELINNRIDSEEIKRILMDEFRLDMEKAQLMIDISMSQRKHIYPIDKNKYSLYVGIPFCPSRCSYCSFPAFGIGSDYARVEEYVDSLIYEIKGIKEIMQGKWLNTLYIGGGTPTAIRTRDLEKIIGSLREAFRDEDIKEFTVEAGRPDTLDYEMLSMLKTMGVDRISINPQTMNSNTLKNIGRNHNIESIISAYKLAKEIGFDIINMDLILGLPGEGIKELAYTLDQIGKLDPENLTVHLLALKRGSRLIDQRDGLYGESDVIREMLNLTEAKAKEMGMYPYYLYRQKQILGNLENVGYSKLDKESIYNISMMEEKETIIGAGLGAVSKFYYPLEDKIQRFPNFKDLRVYSKRIDELIIKKKNFISK